MSRQWIGVYVDNDEDANRLLAALPNLKQTVPSLDWETDFEQDDEEESLTEGDEAVMGTWQAGFTVQGEPVKSIEEARRIAALTDGDIEVVEEEDAENGQWLVTNRDIHRARKLATEGFAVWEGFSDMIPWAITIETP